jgi:hypothetical protein
MSTPADDIKSAPGASGQGSTRTMYEMLAKLSLSSGALRIETPERKRG